MINKNTGHSPMYYYISDNRHEQAVVLVHAAFADHSQFDTQIDSFAEHFTVITVDLIGHGLSTKTQKGSAIGQTSEYLRDILEEEKIDKVHLVGISIGAVLVQDFANKYPDMILSLSCFGGYNINNFDSTLQKGYSKAQRLMMLKAMFSIKWFAESNKLISAFTPEAQDAFYQMNVRFSKKSFMCLAGLNKLINKRPTGQRNYPLLIGCGDKDVPMEMEAVEMWHKDEANSEVVIFKDAGHLVNMDVPDKFNETVLKFQLRA